MQYSYKNAANEIVCQNHVDTYPLNSSIFGKQPEHVMFFILQDVWTRIPTVRAYVETSVTSMAPIAVLLVNCYAPTSQVEHFLTPQC